jgi:hypothetical protein
MIDSGVSGLEWLAISLVEATIQFPNQLFKAHYGLTKGRRVFLVEGHHYFQYDTRNLLFHKKN